MSCDRKMDGKWSFLNAVAGAAVVGVSGIILLAPRRLPRMDLISPWRSGLAHKTLDRNKQYLCYATAAALPGNPWLTILSSSPSADKFRSFSKRIFVQIEECSGLVGHFRVASPLKAEYVWVTVWESKEGLGEFFKYGAHKDAMASYREIARDTGSAPGAPFNLKFNCTGQDIERFASSYGQLTKYWCGIRNKVAKEIQGALLSA
mmetsp:Transcript_35855/g.101494  ORF Transcript_35855/g.101494 Transcript_35855/m.101494 type:complete len:205 (+) Transcript_35855:170-784(+)